MQAVFVANVHLKKNEGIYKKILAEATALGNVLGECDLVIGQESNKNSSIIDTQNGNETSSDYAVLKTVYTVLREKKVDCLYIRLMIPSPQLIKLMKAAEQRGTKVFYEIPTYPYYAEQFRTSRKKYRAIAKIGIDFLFSSSIYKHCYKMPIIRSNTQIQLKDKMIEITNGVKVDNLKEKQYPSKNKDIFRMVTVGTLYPYHGYDRVLLGLKECNEKVNGIPVEFHIVGESQTIRDLERQAKSLGLQRVYFHGVKSTEELNEMYESYDVGLGCLALHRRNADIDTTLKIIEYYCRGVPVVTSGISPMDQYMAEATVRIKDGEDAVSIPDIYNGFKAIDDRSFTNIAKIAKEKFDWNYIFKKMMKESIGI